MIIVKLRNFVLLLCLALFVGAAGYLQLRFKAPLNVPEVGYVVDIRPGDSSARTINRLASDNIIEWPLLFRFYLKWTGRDRTIKAGEYELSKGNTFDDLLKKIDRGEVILREVTLVEGWTVGQAIRHLCAQPGIECTLGADTKSLMTLIRTISSGGNPEGMLYPDTYRYSRGTTDAEIIRKANERLLDVLEAAWKERDPDIPLRTPYEALILASIVEKETSLPEERRKIAGVFTRRLLQNMRLQTDPTIIYGLGEEYAGNITREHLQRYTPYNTYKIDGLPPTPIAIVGGEAIRAVMHPEQGSELYFVARGDGSHVFSSSLAEHNKNVYKYQLKPSARSKKK